MDAICRQVRVGTADTPLSQEAEGKAMIAPQLLTVGSLAELDRSDDYCAQIKADGWRLTAAVTPCGVLLFSRHRRCPPRCSNAV